jgi:hypothetical protein
MAVPKGVHGRTAEEVQVLFAGVVPHTGAFTTGDDDGHTTARSHEDSALDFSPIGH